MNNAKILYKKGVIRNKRMLTQSQILQTAFTGELENVKYFYSALKALNFSENSIIQITDEGFKITVEESRTVQASLYVTRDYFQKFHLQKDVDVSFGIKLNVLTDCLSLFSIGTSSNLKMFYKGTGSPLVLVLEQTGDEKLTTECSIKTNNYENLLDFDLEEDNVENMIILNSPDFATLLNDFDKSEQLEIYISPKLPNFRISTINNIHSEVQVEISKNCEMMHSFSSKSTTKHRYKAAYIRFITKALPLGASISIRTNKDGLLGIQLMIINEGNKQICMEYFIAPLVEEDDD